MKKILIIGAGFLQSFVIKKAKEMGYYTLTIDKNPNAIGFKYADEHEVVDIVNENESLWYARKKDIDGVITVATDYGVLSASYIAEQMNLPGLNYEVAKIVKNKYLVRRNLYNNQIDDIKQFYEIDSLDTLKDLDGKVKFPVIVKPCDGSGSKGIKKVNTFEELVIACNDALDISIVGKVLIEDFIEGKEFGVESFVYNGEVYVLGIMEKKMTSPPKYAELGHTVLIELSIEEKIKRIVTKAINSLGINFGSVNMDLLVTKNGDICIVDVGARMGGNLIGSHLIPLSTGIDYMSIILKAATGESVQLGNKFGEKYVVSRILALSPGKVKYLPDFKEIKKKYQVEIYHSLAVGSEIREYHNNLDGCGYIISISKDKEKAILNADKAIKAIDQNIVKNKV